MLFLKNNFQLKDEGELKDEGPFSHKNSKLEKNRDIAQKSSVQKVFIESAGKRTTSEM